MANDRRALVRGDRNVPPMLKIVEEVMVVVGMAYIGKWFAGVVRWW
jgi:hypothetical protein